MTDLMYGVYMAVVHKNKLNDEAKIEIKIRHVTGETILNARIATLMAGDNYGTLFLPEEGDQVLVAFERGCLNDPIIIGSFWGTKDKAPDDNSNGKNNLKIIKTRGGNEIRIKDKNIDGSGEETIEIISANGKITIKAETITLDGNVKITGTLDVGAEEGPKTHIDKNEITGQWDHDRLDFEG